jgi:chromosome partitioning protein
MSIRVAECSALGISIFKNDPKGKATKAYESLTMEIMESCENGGEQV